MVIVAVANKKAKFNTLLLLLLVVILIGSVSIIIATSNISNDFYNLSADKLTKSIPNTLIAENILMANDPLLESEAINFSTSEKAINDSVTDTGETNPDENILPNSVDFLTKVINTSTIDNSGDNKPRLATVINGQTTDAEFIQNYLNSHKNFTELQFEDIGNRSQISLILYEGAKQDYIKGVRIKNQRYVLDLQVCDRYAKSCAFRVNGLPTSMLYKFDNPDISKQRSFSLNDNYTLKIESMRFDECGNRRFCNVYYQAYDLINVMVVEN